MGNLASIYRVKTYRVQGDQPAKRIRTPRYWHSEHIKTHWWPRFCKNIDRWNRSQQEKDPSVRIKITLEKAVNDVWTLVDEYPRSEMSLVPDRLNGVLQHTSQYVFTHVQVEAVRERERFTRLLDALGSVKYDLDSLMSTLYPPT